MLNAYKSYDDQTRKSGGLQSTKNDRRFTQRLGNGDLTIVSGINRQFPCCWRRVASDISNVNEDSDTINAASTIVADNARDLSGLAGELNTLVEKFTIR